jgi:hypothetical protein
MAGPTLLTITPLSGSSAFTLTPYSARGLTQTLEPISSTGASGGNAMGTWLKRDINGNLVNLAYPQFQKYASTITCRDTETPSFDDAWIGATVQVDCACELNYLTGGSPARPPVSGSERTEGDYTFYRPSLTMMVAEIKNSFAEWEAEYAWQLSLFEV